MMGSMGDHHFSIRYLTGKKILLSVICNVICYKSGDGICVNFSLDVTVFCHYCNKLAKFKSGNLKHKFIVVH